MHGKTAVICSMLVLDRIKESSAVHATVLAHVSKRDKYKYVYVSLAGARKQ